jgi:hypothetical protein
MVRMTRSKAAQERSVARRALAYIAVLIVLDRLAPNLLYALLAWGCLAFFVALVMVFIEALSSLVTGRPRRFWAWCKRAVPAAFGFSQLIDPADERHEAATEDGISWIVRVFGIVMTLIVFGLPWAMWAAGPIGNHNPIRLLLGPYTALVFLLVGHLALLVSIVFGVRWPPLSARRLVAALGAFVLFEVLEVVVIFSAGYVQAFREHSTGALACFSAHSFSHLDALYFTVGTLSTAGTGTLTPASQFCRGIVTFQMVVGIGVLGVLIAGVAAQLASQSTNIEQV